MESKTGIGSCRYTLWIDLKRISPRRYARTGEGMRVYENVDDAVARVEEDVRRAQQRAHRYPALQSAIDGVRARAMSLQRDLVVEVDAAGILRNLEISDDALDRGGRRLAQEIQQLIEKARSGARAQTLAHTAEIMGEDDPIVRSIAADLEAQETGSHNWRTEGRR